MNFKKIKEISSLIGFWLYKRYLEYKRLMFNKFANLIDSFSEIECRELALQEIDEYGRNAIDQGIINDINDPDFWEKVKE